MFEFDAEDGDKLPAAKMAESYEGQNARAEIIPKCGVSVISYRRAIAR
jgi:hypothetical protein